MNYSAEQILMMIFSVSGIMSIVIYALAKNVLPFIWNSLTGKKGDDKKEQLNLAELNEKVFKLETNHLAHIAEDIKNLTEEFRRENEINRLFRERTGERLASIETKIQAK